MAEIEEKNIQQVSFEEHMRDNYLRYALDVVKARALPSVSDGLKPVQRRIIQSMYGLGLHPTSSYKKCARTVGECLGRLHPHGDQSVYDAMITLARPWKQRYPLVDVHGNMGSIDGDKAAAMRYTEGRLAPIGELLMSDMDKNTVNMIPNYDESELEAEELSGLFPTLLCNGSQGIAVGMSCSFVPHRAIDIFNALDCIIKHALEGEEASIDELISIVQAPDFPTGGIITNPSDIYRGYKEGRGTVHIRSKYTIEEHKNGSSSIIVTELPYGVNKTDLVMKIDGFSKDGEIPDIKEVRDESSREGIRLVIDIKRGGNEQFVINKLLKSTELATTVPMLHQASVKGKPKEKLTLKELLEYFLEHAITVVKRKAEFNLEKQQKRLEIVEGFLLIAVDILEAVRMITESETDEEVFEKLDQKAFTEEAEELNASIEYLKTVVSDDEVLLQATRDELKAVAKRFENEKRISEFSATDGSLGDIKDRDLVPLEEIVITRSHKGLIKSVKLNDYNSQKRNGKGVSAKTQEDDFIENVITLKNRDDLVFLTNIGKAYVIPAFRIPIVSKTAAGKYIQNFIPFSENEQVINVFPIEHSEEMKEYSLFFATKNGICKRLSVDDLPVTKNGARIISIAEDDELVSCAMVKEFDIVLLATKKGMAVRTSAANFRVMGRQASGVIGIRFKMENDEVIAAVRANEEDSLLIMSELGIGKRTKAADIRMLENKGGKGVAYYKPSNKTGLMKSVLLIADDETIFVVTQNGMIIRTPAESISTLSRTAAGVRIVNLDEGDTVATVSAAPKAPDEIEDKDNE